MNNNSNIIICKTDDDFTIAKKLTNDYMEWLGMDLCFQGIDEEMDNFSSIYNHPTGCFIYISENGIIKGGVGVRQLERGICEMKRLFVYDQFRGQHFGLLLCQEIIAMSKELGYKKMRLDTVEKLTQAIQLYKNLGFYEISSYYPNPDETVKYFELEL